MTARRETDALVRRILGYGRVFDDSPEADKIASKMKMGALILAGFRELDGRLKSGEPLPEVWDRLTGFRPKVRTDGSDYRYTYPPGTLAPFDCFHVWLDTEAHESACRRCHTIRCRTSA